MGDICKSCREPLGRNGGCDNCVSYHKKTCDSDLDSPVQDCPVRGEL